MTCSCSAGFYWGMNASEAVSACHPCPRGTYANATGLSACANCPANMTSVSHSSFSSSSQCMPSLYF